MPLDSDGLNVLCCFVYFPFAAAVKTAGPSTISDYYKNITIFKIISVLLLRPSHTESVV